MLKELTIISNERVDEGIFLLSLEKDPEINGIPGQFAMIRINESYDPLLSRPLSFYRISSESIDFLYKVVGKGTYILSKKKEREKLKILAPLGKGFPLPKEEEKIAIISGGMGIAPLSFLLDSISPKVEVYSYLGFSTVVSERLWRNFKEKSKFFLISTEDGSFGEKGKILDFVSNFEEFNFIYACGPISMLKTLWEKMEDKSKLYFSLEEKMGCGFGVCLSCVFHGRKGNLHICKDGPVLSGMEVIFDEF